MKVCRVSGSCFLLLWEEFGLLLDPIMFGDTEELNILVDWDTLRYILCSKESHVERVSQCFPQFKGVVIHPRPSEYYQFAGNCSLDTIPLCIGQTYSLVSGLQISQSFPMIWTISMKVLSQEPHSKSFMYIPKSLSDNSQNIAETNLHSVKHLGEQFSFSGLDTIICPTFRHSLSAHDSLIMLTEWAGDYLKTHTDNSIGLMLESNQEQCTRIEEYIAGSLAEKGIFVFVGPYKNDLSRGIFTLQAESPQQVLDQVKYLKRIQLVNTVRDWFFDPLLKIKHLYLDTHCTLEEINHFLGESGKTVTILTTESSPSKFKGLSVQSIELYQEVDIVIPKLVVESSILVESIVHTPRKGYSSFPCAIKRNRDTLKLEITALPECEQILQLCEIRKWISVPIRQVLEELKDLSPKLSMQEDESILISIQAPKASITVSSSPSGPTNITIDCADEHILTRMTKAVL